MTATAFASLRIGELSRRVGATPAVIRAWERRYGLLRPERSPAGYRLYSDADLARAAEMAALLARGVAPAQAAEIAKATRTSDAAGDLMASAASDLFSRLRQALDRYDGAAAEGLVERSLFNLGLAGAIQTVLLPYLRDLGTRWERNEISVAQEHFASNTVRRGLLRAADGWERGDGRAALLACAPGEQHDIGLLCFGLSLHSYHGWRIKYLGTDLPVADVARAASVVRPEVVVLSAVTPARFFADLGRWRELSREFALAIGGAGATSRLARRLGASFLSGDPVSAATRVAAAA